MYLKNINLDNVGPIHRLNLALKFNDDGTPQPTVIVGRNGSGKSLLLAHVVNALIAAKNTLYDDVEVEKGKVFKYRSPVYIQSGQHYYSAILRFTDDFFQSEVQLDRTKSDFESQYGYGVVDVDWLNMPNDTTSHYMDNFHNRDTQLRKTLGTSCQLYFPPNRFEEPAWLNQENLLNRANYLGLKPISGISNRTLITYSPMKTNQEWLLDLIYDCNVLERRFIPLEPNGPGFVVNVGPATDLVNVISEFVCKLLSCSPPIQWNVGGRGRRSVSIIKDGQPLVSNLFALSTGQAVLLDLFLSIIRDCDIDSGSLKSLSDAKGIVIVDEIDLHLHADMQHDLLPTLLSQFPSVQFILTSHSPLFVMGMKRAFGEERFAIVDFPSGQEISTEQFSEFENAYTAFQSSVRYATDLKAQITQSKKPILFVEGTLDIDYLKLAASHLGETETLSKFNIYDGNGFGGLDKVWAAFNTPLGEAINQRIVLLYDCDVDKKSTRKSTFICRYIVPQRKSLIEKGIENLLGDDIVKRAHQHKAAFFDVVEAHKIYTRGVQEDVPEKWQINKDEKANLQKWCNHSARSEDLKEFRVVFEFLKAELAGSPGGVN